MPFKCTTPKKKIDAHVDDGLSRIDKDVIRSLSYVGEQVLNAARSTNSYKDRTGNLRSGIGYVVAREGEIVKMSDFKIVTNGTEGSKEGMSYAKELASRFNRGYALIVVAGMNYAFYVKKKGYDVIDSAELIAERLVPKMLKDLKSAR